MTKGVGKREKEGEKEKERGEETRNVGGNQRVSHSPVKISEKEGEGEEEGREGERERSRRFVERGSKAGN